jgi:hypothetical protein
MCPGVRFLSGYPLTLSHIRFASTALVGTLGDWFANDKWQ